MKKDKRRPYTHNSTVVSTGVYAVAYSAIPKNQLHWHESTPEEIEAWDKYWNLYKEAENA